MVSSNLSQKAMEKSMDALWMKMRVHMDNIANYETPEFKAKKVEFSEVLSETKCKHKSEEGTTMRLNVTEDDSTSIRVDGNNVDMESEQLELWKTQAQYAAVAQKISGKYSNLRTIISTVGR